MANKQSRKKILAVLIASVMTAAIIASCGGDDNTPQQSNVAEVNNENGEHTGGPIEEEEDPRILPNLDPDTDWGGHVFKVITNSWADSGDWADWRPRDIYSEAETGNPLNDAVYRRNATLEQRYNFTIQQVISDTNNANTEMRRAVQAGDRSFDAVSVTMNDTISSAQEGFLVDRHSVPHIELEQPWWDQGANYGMSIGGRLFLTSGDFVLVNRDACPGLLFNKQLLQDLQLENPYDLVRNGQWTLGKLYEMSRDAGADLGGTGEPISWRTWETARYGLIAQRDSIVAFFHGAGGRMSSKDNDDMPTFIFDNERTFAIMDAAFDVMLNESAINLHRIPSPIYPKSEVMFQDDRGLFMWVRLRIVENLRGMETDFGILPMPWFDENQQEWHHTVNRFTGHAMALPKFHDDDTLARAGFMLEAIAAESRYTVIPAYYDVQLSTQITRDEESSEMLDIIFSTTVWDTGEIYNWGDMSWQLLAMIDAEDRNLSSRLERHEVRIERDMTRTIDRYAEID
jgi:hypothetical protein